jgi:hypothetical protein
MAKFNFDQIIEINGNKFTKQYIQSLSFSEREELVEPIFELFRENGLVLPDNIGKLKKSYEKLCELKINVDDVELFNNSSLGTDICKYFCKSFYEARGNKGKTIWEIFNDDGLMRRLIRNRLGMDWLLEDKKGPGVNEAFNFSPKMLIQGMRSMMLVSQVSMFKPSIAKYIYTKYSEPGDLVGDYSAGFGGRLLGAMSCGRRYIGVDPLTVPELGEMAKWYGFKDYELRRMGSEYWDDSELDLCFSSPPYFNQEVYSNDLNQSYNRGEDYFYNTYWAKTLKNIKKMLKKEKWFGLNVINYPKMVDMAREEFGEEKEIIKLKIVRSHLSKSAGVIKFEPIYMFKNT